MGIDWMTAAELVEAVLASLRAPSSSAALRLRCFPSEGGSVTYPAGRTPGPEEAIAAALPALWVEKDADGHDRYSAAEIGAILRLECQTKSAVLGMGHRLCLPKRDSSGGSTAAPVLGTRTLIRHAPKLPSMAWQTSRFAKCRRGEPAVKLTCQWIEGDNRKTRKFCGAAVKRKEEDRPQSAYCAVHHARCWQRPYARALGGVNASPTRWPQLTVEMDGTKVTLEMNFPSHYEAIERIEQLIRAGRNLVLDIRDGTRADDVRPSAQPKRPSSCPGSAEERSDRFLLQRGEPTRMFCLACATAACCFVYPSEKPKRARAVA